MAIVSSYREASCQVRQRARSSPLVAIGGKAGNSKGTAGAKPEEGEGDGRSVCPESPGLHAGYNAQDNGMQPRKGKPSP